MKKGSLGKAARSTLPPICGNLLNVVLTCMPWDADPDELGATLGLIRLILSAEAGIDMKALKNVRWRRCLYNLNPKVDDLLMILLSAGQYQIFARGAVKQEELPAIAKRILLYAVLQPAVDKMMWL